MPNKILSQLGSESAMSLVANNPAALAAGAVLLGVTAVVTGVTFIYQKWEDYEEQKHLRQIQKINELHQQILTKISIDEHCQTVSLPPIFELKDGIYTSITFTEAALREIAHGAGTVGDRSLNAFKTHIRDAIRLLIDYYNHQRDKKNLTVPVLFYLIHVLDSKCSAFRGYSYDIAYLKALLTFINEYTQLNDEKDPLTEHFAGFSPVFACLTYALYELKKHKNAQTQVEILKESTRTTKEQCENLLRGFLKLITPSEDWSQIETTPLRIMRDGTISVASVRRYFFDCCHQVTQAEKLPDSILKKWSSMLIRYFLSADDLDTLQMPSLSLFSISTHRLLEHDMKSIQHIFSTCDNFLTTILDKQPPCLQFVPVTDIQELNKRLMVLAEYAKLCHLLTSFLCVLNELAQLTESLGTLEANDPQKCLEIYRLHDNLCHLIKKQTKTIQHALWGIQEASHNAMPPTKIYRLFTSLIASLDTIHATISNHAELIAERRMKLDSVQVREALRINEHKLISALNAEYGFTSPPSLAASGEVTPNSLPKLPARLPTPKANALSLHPPRVPSTRPTPSAESTHPTTFLSETTTHTLPGKPVIKRELHSPVKGSGVLGM